MQAGQREPLECPGEAAVRSPLLLARECARLRAGALGEPAVGDERGGAARGVVCGARAGGDAVEPGQLGVAPARADRADRGEGVRAGGLGGGRLQWRQVGDEEREPERLLDVRLRRHLGVQPRRRRGQLGQAAGGEGQLVGQAVRVRPGVDAGDELGLVAVLDRPGRAADRDGGGRGGG